MQLAGLVDNKQVLYLPSFFKVAYSDELACRGLLAAAQTGSSAKNIHGGPSAEATNLHFTHRFANSASRLLCLLIDPAKHFGGLPTAISTTFSSHKIAVLDVPCGSGASLLSLLSAIVVAREQQQLPQLPLSVGIVAADISPTALDIYTSLVSRLSTTFLNYDIHLQLSTHVWDATDVQQTSLICDEMLFRQHPDANEYFVLVSNLSGVGTALEKSFSRSFQHVTERISNVLSTVLWVEPAISNSFLAAIKQIFNLSKWLNPSPHISAGAGCRFEWEQPVLRKVLNGSVMVQQFERKNGVPTP